MIRMNLNQKILIMIYLIAEDKALLKQIENQLQLLEKYFLYLNLYKIIKIRRYIQSFNNRIFLLELKQQILHLNRDNNTFQMIINLNKVRVKIKLKAQHKLLKDQ